MSKETKKRMSLSHIGLKHSEKTKRKISLSKIGKSFHTKEWRELMSKKMKGNTHGFQKGIGVRVGIKSSKESIDKQKEIFKKNYIKENHPNYGKKLSKELCKKKSESIKIAYQKGRMKHMEKVWKNNSKKWQGENNPRWSKIGHINGHGYKMIHDDEGEYRVEHRIVAEKIIFRKLKRHETIHHINEDKSDNRQANLYYFFNDNLHKRHHGLKIKPTLKSNLRFIE